MEYIIGTILGFSAVFVVLAFDILLLRYRRKAQEKEKIHEGSMTMLEAKSINTPEYTHTTGELETFLEELFYEKHSASYMGGTLGFNNPKEPHELILLNFSMSTLSSVERFWLAMLYIKHKTPNHVHWDESMQIIENHPVPEAAKLLLERIGLGV